MNHLKEIDNFSEIFKSNTPLLDVRAPIEFVEGSFPHTHNYPIITDSERHQIGICYKENGQKSAVRLGHELVSGKIKEERVDKWSNFVKQYPKGALYCFRGGLRSKISQEWIYEHSGVYYPRIKGGYKALRSFLIDEMHRISSQKSFVVIGGQTGCGKTILLNKFDNSLDLEGIANHRGSAFGNNVTPQPKQIDFENYLSVDLIKKELFSHILIEDEGNNIGTIYIPEAIKMKSRESKIVILRASLEDRIGISLQAYVIDMTEKFTNQDVINGFENFSNYWLNSLIKIKKRLGGLRYKSLLNQLNLALKNHKKNNDLNDYLPLIESLLVDYYDPMYNFQINNKKQRIIFEGDCKEVTNFLQEFKS
jgi:tRNA 2-selenouridine synthase